MTRFRIFAALFATLLCCAHAAQAQDLSSYRQFRIGMNTGSMAPLIGSPDVRIIHTRPALLQEMQWWPAYGVSGGSLRVDPVQRVVLGFYDDQLFRIDVLYDSYRTTGMTNEDLVESFSASYGRPTPMPLAARTFQETAVKPSWSSHDEVVARWEDAQQLVTLLRSDDQRSIRLAIVSKVLESRAEAATAEAMRLDVLEAPEREIARQKQDRQDEHAAQDKAR